MPGALIMGFGIITVDMQRTLHHLKGARHTKAQFTKLTNPNKNIHYQKVIKHLTIVHVYMGSCHRNVTLQYLNGAHHSSDSVHNANTPGKDTDYQKSHPTFNHSACQKHHMGNCPHTAGITETLGHLTG